MDDFKHDERISINIRTPTSERPTSEEKTIPSFEFSPELIWSDPRTTYYATIYTMPRYGNDLASILNSSLYDTELKADDKVKLKLDITEAKQKGESPCAVCQSDIEVGNKVSELPCKHTFHAECIQNWGKYKQTCPICRSKIKHSRSNK